MGVLCLKIISEKDKVMADSNQFVCTTCGYVGKRKKVAKGSFLLELFLWLFFILPGVIYSVYRLSTKQKVCPKCGNATMIPTDTPAGRKLTSNESKDN
jgi:ribosomal protein S27AE